MRPMRLLDNVRTRLSRLIGRRQAEPADLVTVVISTYNFSAALRCAIESVVMQTHQEFELLVVGDGCTDDSEQVVRSFGDPRIAWFNLPENVGSQYAPNNFALARAKGTYVAYLGHDDIWAPNHLATGLAAMRVQDADLTCAVAILYGPPEASFMGAIGLFPDDTYTLRYHCPTPAVIHRLNVIDRVGLWRSPSESEIGTDLDFIARCYRAGAKIVPTRQPTVFKFSTTWRRDAYRRKDVSDQQRTLAALRADADGFVQTALMSVIQCALEDRFIRIEAPSRPDERAAIDAALVASRWLRFKGARSRHPTTTANLADGPYRFFFDEEFVGYEWHLPEDSPVHGRYRWSGPSCVSMIPLPVRLDTPARLRMLIVHTLDPDVLSTLVLRFNGRELAWTITPAEFATSVIEASLSPEPNEDEQEITLEVARTIRPFDAHGSSDRRWLGVAVGWIELSAPTSPVRPQTSAE